MYGMSEICYVTLTDGAKPILLARVRWPDVAEAISIGCPRWQTDPGLFDLPYDAHGVQVSRDRAEEIAAAWGTELEEGSSQFDARPSLIRRMPANWSNLTSAERRAWSLEERRVRRRTRRQHARRSARTAAAPVDARQVARGEPLEESREEGFLPAIDSLEHLVSRGIPEAAVAVGPSPADVPSAGELDGEGPTGPPTNAPSSSEAPYANLNDPRLAGLRLPVGDTRATPRRESNPIPVARPRPGVR